MGYATYFAAYPIFLISLMLRSIFGSLKTIGLFEYVKNSKVTAVIKECDGHQAKE